jgi:hypothetical protein
MDVRDYDFHLFIDAETGAESVVSRVGPTGYRLTRLAGQGPIIADGDCFAAPITVDVHPVPTRTVTQMARRLEIAALGYRFFCDAHTSKAAVLYRRYDGQLGLVCGEPR